jgi:hypothetical protein
MTFQHLFSSEALLQQAIAGLLMRMPDLSGVQILQGTQELGKDIVFYIRGGFGESVLCACVVKNSKITGDAGKSEGARTVYFQAQQAFDSVHTDEFGKEIRVERVYVVTPFPMPPATITSIKGRLEERAGQVVFIAGPTLFDLFKKYWPDYFADEATAIENHLNETRDIFEAESPLPGLIKLYDLGSISTYPKKVYVPQVFYRDIFSYNLGPLLADSLQKLVQRELTDQDRDRLKANLKEVASALSYLCDWGYDLNEEKSKVQSIMDEILDTFEIAAARSPKRGHYESQGTIRLRKSAVFLKMIQALEEQKKVALEKIQLLLSDLSHYVSQEHSKGIDAPTDLLFLRYCTLDDCARTAPDRMFSSQKHVRIKFPKNILEGCDNSILIVGAPGYGKTSFCRWHALKDAENYTAGKSTILPVYLQLHRFSSKDLGSFEETFLQPFNKSALVSGRDKDLKTRIRIYLDGLDEIASSERRREIVELARNGVKGNERYQIILTSRDHIYAKWLEWLPRLSLGEFAAPEISELIDKWLGQDTESRERFSNELREVPSLGVLMQIPLLATLIIMVFRQTGKLPATKVRLYEIFIDILSGGWDIAKGIIRESIYEKRVKVMILRTLASKLHEQRRRAFDSDDLKGIVRLTMSKSMLKDWASLRTELLTDGLITGTGNIYQFSHFSFQEFLTAKEYMGSPHPMRASNALELYFRGEDWWREVVNFYIALSTSPREAIHWLVNEIQGLKSRRITIPEAYLNDTFARLLEAFPEYPLERLAMQLRPIQAQITTLSLRARREELIDDMRIVDNI